jgi:hypothetical protein
MTRCPDGREAAPQSALPREEPAEVSIYVTAHCENCRYALEMAAYIRQHFPQVAVCVVDLATTTEQVPPVVFATPTYLLNGRVWSLGNPDRARVQRTLQPWAQG